MGEMILHGPHHVAQKSMTTGLSPLIYISRGGQSFGLGCARPRRRRKRTTLLNSSRLFRTATVMVDVWVYACGVGEVCGRTGDRRAALYRAPPEQSRRSVS